jgi:predicted outer membrane protein
MTANRPSRRLQRWSVGLLAFVLVALLAPTAAAQAHVSAKAPADVPIPPQTNLSPDGVGSVSAADRDFVTKVRLAGLWEIPAGVMAQDRSDDPRIVKIGKSIAEQHVELDKLAREAAAKLQIPLPAEPNAEQQGWLNEMKTAENSDAFDQVYIDRLRAAHGKIFPAIANIRAGTRNDVVRRLAQEANQFVMTHLTLLESSGLVDYGSLPAPPQPVAGNAAPNVDGRMIDVARTNGGVPGVNPNVILIVLAAALIAGVVSTMRIFRTR